MTLPLNDKLSELALTLLTLMTWQSDSVNGITDDIQSSLHFDPLSVAAQIKYVSDIFLKPWSVYLRVHLLPVRNVLRRSVKIRPRRSNNDGNMECAGRTGGRADRSGGRASASRRACVMVDRPAGEQTGGCDGRPTCDRAGGCAISTCLLKMLIGVNLM